MSNDRDSDKRWRDRQERWVAPDRGVFDPRGYAVDVLAEAQAKAFVLQHHYAGSFPAARLSVGLYGPGASLVGVAVFSVGVQHTKVIAKYAGLPANQGHELGRFVCAESVAYNGETWFLARAFKLLVAEKQARAVVSYADPLERSTAGGVLCKPAHWGTIYQASNALHLGRASARTLLIAPDGWVCNPRSLAKVEQEHRGWRYVSAQIVAHGAPPRAPHEALSTWAARMRQWPGWRRVRHPGNLVYAFGLDAAQRAALAARHGNGLTYPQRKVA